MAAAIVLPAAFLGLIACRSNERADVVSSTDRARGSSSSAPSGTATSAAAPKAAMAPLDLKTVDAPTLQARFVDSGWADVTVESVAGAGEWQGFEVESVAKKVKLRVMNFAKPLESTTDLPSLMDVNEKRTLIVSATKKEGTAANDQATLALLIKSGCADRHSCGKALRDAGYTEVAGDESRSADFGLGFSLLTAHKGAAVVQAKVYDYEGGSKAFSVLVRAPIVVGASATDGSVDKAAVDRFVDCLR